MNDIRAPNDGSPYLRGVIVFVLGVVFCVLFYHGLLKLLVAAFAPGFSLWGLPR